LLPERTRQLLRAVGRRFHDGRCAQVAASLAFTTLLSLVPFVTLVAVVFSRLPQSARLDAALRGFCSTTCCPRRRAR
jgi:membrane protein